jgi:hypothetical protein
VGSGSESDTLEGVEIIEMWVLTDRGVVGGVGGGEYNGRGVGGRGNGGGIGGRDNAEDIMSKDSGGIMSRSRCDFL